MADNLNLNAIDDEPIRSESDEDIVGIGDDEVDDDELDEEDELDEDDEDLEEA